MNQFSLTDEQVIKLMKVLDVAIYNNPSWTEEDLEINSDTVNIQNLFFMQLGGQNKQLFDELIKENK